MRAKLHLSSHPAVDKSPALWGWDFSLRVLYNLISFSVSTRALSPSSVIYIISKLFLDVLRTDIAQTWLVFFEMPPLEWIQMSSNFFKLLHWVEFGCVVQSFEHAQLEMRFKNVNSLGKYLHLRISNSLWIARRKIFTLKLNAMRLVGSWTQRCYATLAGAVFTAHNHRHHGKGLEVQFI